MATKTWLGTTSSDLTVAANWSPSGQPTAADDVIITGSNAIGGGTLSASGNLASFIVRDFTSTIGTSTADLVVDLAASSTVTISTSAKAYIDFNASDVNVTVYRTLPTADGVRGLELKGSGLNYVYGYNASSIRLFSGTLDNDFILYDSSGSATIESGAGAVSVRGAGEFIVYGSLTNIFTDGGNVTYYGGGAITTATSEGGGLIKYRSGQNIGTANAHGGTIDGSVNNETLTITTTSVRDGGEIIPGDNWTVPTPSSNYKITAA